MSKKRFAEAAFMVGSLLAGEAAGQNKQAETKAPQKTEQTKKGETAVDPEIKAALEEQAIRLKNPENAKDPGLVKFIEQSAYKKIAKIVVERLGKYNKPGLLTDQLQADLKVEAKKLGLTYDMLGKCIEAADSDKAFLYSLAKLIPII